MGALLRITTTFLITIHMCTGNAASNQQRKFNAKYQNHEKNITTQPPETTTIFPVNPYVFSAEDYDILQNAESLQQALSIVAYEPQKIDPKKTQNNFAEVEHLGKVTQNYQITTQVPPEKQYYEVPRKQSRTPTYATADGRTNTQTPILVEQPLPIKRAFEITPRRSHTPDLYQHHQNFSSVTPFSYKSFARNNQLYSPSTEQTPTANIVDSTNNYPIISKATASKIDQSGRETSKSEASTPSARKKRRKFVRNPIQQQKQFENQQHSLQQRQQEQQKQLLQQAEQEQQQLLHQQRQQHLHQRRPQRQRQEPQQQASLLIPNDRIPRPFSLPPEINPTKQPPTYLPRISVEQSAYEPLNLNPTVQATDYSSRTGTARQSRIIQVPTPATEQTYNYNYPTVPVRQTVSRPTDWTDQSFISPTVSSRQNSHNLIPKRREYVDVYSTPPVRQEQTISQSTFSAKQEQPRYQTIPLRRNVARNARPHEQIEAQSNISIEKTLGTTASSLPKQEPIVYTIPRRPQQKSVRSNVPTRQESIVPHSTLPSRQLQSNLLSYPTVSTKQEQVPINSIRQEQIRNYQAIPSRRNTARQNLPKEHTEAYSNVPRTVQYSNPPLRPNKVPENIEYEVVPPTVTIEPRVHPTIVQPIYVPKATKSIANRDEQANRNNDYTDNDDDTENNNNDDSDDDHSNNNNNNGNKNNNIDNKHYSYSHVERSEEPIYDEPRNEYEVIEDTDDYPEQQQQPIKAYPTLQRGALKRVEPDYDGAQAQYVDYDQAGGQNVQKTEVAVPHERGDPQDLVEEAGHHKEHHKPKEENSKGEKGGGEEHHEEGHHAHGKKGHKGYKEHHEHDEGEKGHHDKENHDHHYEEKEGKDKKHHDEAGYHEHHEKGEEGEKKTAFSEKGKHNKGHSTKGEHVIHKKDEFEKKTEFFDEFHEGGDLDKEGGHHEEHHHKKGGHHKKGHHHKGHHDEKHGEKGHHEKGHHHHAHKGHDKHEGHDHHHHHEEKHGKKGGHDDHKHWHHKKG